MHRELCPFCEKGGECACDRTHNHFTRFSLPCASCQSKLVRARCPGCSKPHFTIKPDGFCKTCKVRVKKATS